MDLLLFKQNNPFQHQNNTCIDGVAFSQKIICSTESRQDMMSMAVKHWNRL